MQIIKNRGGEYFSTILIHYIGNATQVNRNIGIVDKNKSLDASPLVA